MEYYSATKKNEIMPFAATWMDLEIIILRECRTMILQRKGTKKYESYDCPSPQTGENFQAMM